MQNGFHENVGFSRNANIQLNKQIDIFIINIFCIRFKNKREKLFSNSKKILSEIKKFMQYLFGYRYFYNRS